MGGSAQEAQFLSEQNIDQRLKENLNPPSHSDSPLREDDLASTASPAYVFLAKKIGWLGWLDIIFFYAHHNRKRSYTPRPFSRIFSNYSRLPSHFFSSVVRRRGGLCFYFIPLGVLRWRDNI